MVCQAGMYFPIHHWHPNTNSFLQVANFLNKMAREIDTDIPGVVEHPERLPGNIASHPGANKKPDLAPKPEFVSMRRKLALPLGL